MSLQALMRLLGHVSAEMSLRYAHLFDHTVRAEYERALDLAKTRIGPILPPGRNKITVAANGCSHHDDDWRDAPAIKARLAGGHCLRAPVQGACVYANICEHCPNFRTDPTNLGVLAAQRIDTEAVIIDAEQRGWIDEADRPPSPPHPPRHPHRTSRMTTPHDIETICQRLANDGQPITFPAAAAGVSRTTLCRDPDLRAVIEEHRHRLHDPRTLTGLTAEIGHPRTALNALADRVRHQEERLRRLEPPARTAPAENAASSPAIGRIIV